MAKQRIKERRRRRRRQSFIPIIFRRPFFRKNVKERHIGGDHFTKGESYYLIEQEIFALSIMNVVEISLI